MSDLILNVQQTQPFDFSPNQLTIRTISTDVPAGTAVVYYELIQSGLDNSRYISREWVDRGNVTVPLALLAASTDGQGNINPAVVNQFLAVFHLELV